MPPTKRSLIGLVAASLVLAGCASGTSAGTAARNSAVPSPSAAAEAAQYARNTPPDSAKMICSDEIRGEVADALAIPAAQTQSTWADHVYTCAYALPMGPLVLSVTVTPSDAAAQKELATLRSGLSNPTAEPGLGQAGYSSDAGTVVAAKDNMVLRVDATALPDNLGTVHERRVDFARVIAAGVFSCWNGT